MSAPWPPPAGSPWKDEHMFGMVAVWARSTRSCRGPSSSGASRAGGPPAQGDGPSRPVTAATPRASPAAAPPTSRPRGLSPPEGRRRVRRASLPTRTSASSTARRAPRSSSRRPCASGSRRSPSPTTTAATASSALPRRRAGSACRPSSAPSSAFPPLATAAAGERAGAIDPDATHLVVLAARPGGLRPAVGRDQPGAARRGEKGRPALLPRRAGRGPRRATGASSPGAGKGRCPPRWSDGGPAAAARELDRLVEAFGRENVVVELFDHDDPLDSARNDALAALAARAGLGIVATTNAHYADARGATRLATALAAVRARRQPRRARRLAPAVGGGVAALGGRAGAALPPLPGGRRARRRSSGGRAPSTSASSPPACPPFPVPSGEDEASFLRRLVEEGATRRYGPREPSGCRARGEQIERELGDHRGARLPRLLPRRLGHRRVLPALGHLLPGPRLGGELGGLLRARDHERRRRRARPVVRAVPVAGARRAARHRRRHRVRPARGGHRVRLRALRA